MSVELKLRGGTTAECAAMTPAERETVVDTTLDTLRVGDGSTAGGHRLAKYAELGFIITMATDRLLGRDMAGSGAVEELTVGGGLEFTGSGGVQRSALTGDVTASAGSNATTIANNAVTTAKIANLAVTLGKIEAITGPGVLGQSDGVDGSPEVIGASTNNTVLKRAGDALLFDEIVNADIDTAAAIALSKLANVNTDRLLGRTTAGSGAIEEIPVTDFVQTIFDDADAGTVRGTLGFGTYMLHSVLSLHANAGAGTTWTDMPLASSFFLGSNRAITSMDCTYYTQCRLVVRVTTASGSANTPKFRLRYHTAFSTTIGDYVDMGTSEVACSLASTGLIRSSWIDLAASAKADVYIICEGVGGDGAADPVVCYIQAEFRRQ